MPKRSFADEIIYGTAKSVEESILAGTSVDELDEYGYVPIVEAAIANKTDVAKVLLKHKAYVDQTDSTGRTALHWAVDNNNVKLVELLLKNKANPNACTLGGQPVLTYALLRRYHRIKNLLYDHGADLNLALDFINTKLIGHRFELQSQVHIVDKSKQFMIIDLEGFFLEFTVAIIEDSLQRFKNNFAAKELKQYFDFIEVILHVFESASELVRFRQYSTDLKKQQKRIDQLLNPAVCYIPLGYEGHAISCIKVGSFFAKCDRNPYNNVSDGIEIFQITKPQNVTKEFLEELYFTKLDKHFVEREMHRIMGLQSITTLPVSWQVAGNCSWANIEAAVPTMLLMLSLTPRITEKELDTLKRNCLAFYFQWREWDKDRALYECIQSFHEANELRQAAKAELLAAVLVFSLKHNSEYDIERARKILKLLTRDKHQFILKNYIKVYCRDRRTKEGENLQAILNIVKPPNWFG